MKILRNTQWLSGLELFDYNLNQNLILIQEIESFFNASLPGSIKQYLLHFNAINIMDISNYDEGVSLEDCNIIFENSINPLLHEFNTCYNVPEILNRLKNFDSEISEIYRSNLILPICPGIPAHDIFYSFKSAESFGRLYYDYEYEFYTNNEYLFANSIWDFICNIKIIEDKNF
ncbi:MAG: hypothetical protein IPK35_19735 [Saprospiraceae bacterium]|jgi:hypothetical protein|nr:hypothetical protein [Saprospiraceae bacterium]